jgi:lysophospholipase L1-like esterase
VTPPGQFFRIFAGLLTSALAVGAQEIAPERQESRDWRAEIIRVHSRFRGRPGTFAHFGDSITETLAFWAPLRAARKDAPPQMVDAFRRVEPYLRPECWRDWKGPEFGNQGGRTIRWADQNLGEWLERLQPEVALVMFGTNDLRDTVADEYRDRLGAVVRRCLDRGTVVILSTIPPRHGLAKESAAFADVARKVARELAVPLVDYHAEILKRRPYDWDGASNDFRMFTGYDVPTLLARDGVHPSAPARYRDTYSAEALRCHGYGLRNYLVLLKYAEVVEVLAESQRTGTTSGHKNPQPVPLSLPMSRFFQLHDRPHEEVGPG